MSDDPRHRTLFAIDALDRRARQRLMGGRRRTAGNQRARSSDVTRMRALLVAAGLAAIGVAAGWVMSPSGYSTNSGQLSLPHQQAGLSCEQCHREGNEPGDSCQGCHGKHTSVRRGHARLMATGKLGCINCHDIHGSDQGVRWLPNQQRDSDNQESVTLRYWVGRTQRVAPSHLHVQQATTVPLVPLARCRTCHLLNNKRDPLWRCVAAGDDIADAASISGCFDEHRSATDMTDHTGKVCASQHRGQRFDAWEAARLTLAQPVGKAEAPRYPWHWLWLLTGALLAALGHVGTRLWQRHRRRARRDGAATQVALADRVRLPQINTNTCLGCFACVDACPYDVLEIERYVARVARPQACCGLILCEQVCPNGSLVITDGEPIVDRPVLDEQLQAPAAPGVYLAGDITGLPLIKNAIAQGHRAVDAISTAIKSHPHQLDVVIVGAGPAGISAALRAKELKLRYRVLEQGSVAQSIRSFPRGKLVFAQPLNLPVVGTLWLEEASKEELLSKWLRIVRREELAIQEHTRFVSANAITAGFEVAAQSHPDGTPQAITTATILLCIGQRGSPRKLATALSPATESKVFYHLADARSFAGKRSLVVGLGDVAMETAIALSRQPAATVALAYRGGTFSRGKARNVAEVKRLLELGRLTMYWNAEVEKVATSVVTLRVAGKGVTLKNDALFVMIGSLTPTGLLRQLGVALSRAEETN